MSLRFCFPTTFYPPFNFGGDGIAVRRLARALVARGHRVTVVHDEDAYRLFRRRPSRPVPEEPPGLEVVRLRSRLGPVSPLLTHQTGRPVVHGRALHRLLDGGGFDVVHFHNVSLLGGPGVMSYGGDALRLYTAHEHWLVCPMHVLWRHDRELCSGRECLRCTLAHRRPPQAYRWGSAMERGAAAIDTFIALSEFSRDKHREFGFEPPMEVLPPFLGDRAPEAPGAAPPHPRPYFLFVGRLEAIKGLQDVIPCFDGVEGPDLVVAGDGDYGASLRALAVGRPRVHFLGRVAPTDLDTFYRHAVASVVPSLCWETFGITLIEAFRQGTPVVARRLGPFPEIVERAGGGLLFETGAELRAALERMAGDRAARDTMGRRAAEAFTTTWSERTVVPRYLDLVRRTALRRGRHDLAEALAAEASA